MEADVTDEDQVRGMYERAKQEFGRIDVLFNNAGINPTDDSSVLDTSLEAWQRVQDVNVRSVFLCCKHGIPHLLEGDGGSVINTASFVAMMGAAVSQSSYTASKGAVLAMSRELGVEFARRGVRVNALCPGRSIRHSCRSCSPKTRRRLRAGWCTCRWGASASGGDRQAAIFLASDDSSLHHRLHVHRRRRPFVRVPDSGSDRIGRFAHRASTASSQRLHRSRPSRLNESIFAPVSARSATGSTPISTASGSER